MPLALLRGRALDLLGRPFAAVQVEPHQAIVALHDAAAAIHVEELLRGELPAGDGGAATRVRQVGHFPRGCGCPPQQVAPVRRRGWQCGQRHGARQGTKHAKGYPQPTS